MKPVLLDPELIADIKRVERVTGRPNLFAGFVSQLEGSLAEFRPTFSDCIARGDTSGAVRAAHTLLGACRQLGARELSDLFAAIEISAKAGDYAEAQRKFDSGATLIAQSLEALKRV
jgi:HPt (histidine-containing phosphotransfer) domain-containing protein